MAALESRFFVERHEISPKTLISSPSLICPKHFTYTILNKLLKATEYFNTKSICFEKRATRKWFSCYLFNL